MKKVLLVATTALFMSNIASAELVDNSSVRVNAVKSSPTNNTVSNSDKSNANAKQVKIEYCKGLTQVSGAIMKQRQLGATKKSLQDEISSNPYVVVRQQGAVMIESAFNKPIEDSVEDKNKAIQSFEKDYYNYCLSL